MLFIIYRSAFNTIIPKKLIPKHLDFGLVAFICNWRPDLLTRKPHSIRTAGNISSILMFNTGASHGCGHALLPSPFKPMTVWPSTAQIQSLSSSIIPLVSWTNNNDEMTKSLVLWWQINILVLNVSKRKGKPLTKGIGGGV